MQKIKGGICFGHLLEIGWAWLEVLLSMTYSYNVSSVIYS